MEAVSLLRAASTLACICWSSSGSTPVTRATSACGAGEAGVGVGVGWGGGRPRTQVCGRQAQQQQGPGEAAADAAAGTAQTQAQRSAAQQEGSIEQPQHCVAWRGEARQGSPALEGGPLAAPTGPPQPAGRRPWRLPAGLLPPPGVWTSPCPAAAQHRTPSHLQEQAAAAAATAAVTAAVTAAQGGSVRGSLMAA